LGEALDAVAIRCPVATTVRVTDARRFAPEIETAVYFCCREALQNVAKHARAVAGGDIAVRSRVGAGTTVAGAIPLRDRDEPDGLPGRRQVHPRQATERRA
jgi:hypothetical protein